MFFILAFDTLLTLQKKICGARGEKERFNVNERKRHLGRGRRVEHVEHVTRYGGKDNKSVIRGESRVIREAKQDDRDRGD